MRLIDHYRGDVAGLSKGDAQVIRQLWFRAVRETLCEREISSDRCTRDGYQTVRYVPAWRFRNDGELIELYRATKPKAY